MAAERMPLDELHEAARQEGIDDLDKVRVAVLEPSGRISFIKTRAPRRERARPRRAGLSSPLGGLAAQCLLADVVDLVLDGRRARPRPCRAGR